MLALKVEPNRSELCHLPSALTFRKLKSAALGIAALVAVGAFSVPSAAADTGLVAAYDGGIHDYSGNGNDGDASGITWAEGKYGYAAEFDARGDEILIPDSASLRMDTAITLEAWVYLADTSKLQTVLHKGTWSDMSYSLTAVGQQEYGSGPTYGPSVMVNVMGGGGRGIVGFDKLPSNTWTHIAGTYDTRQGLRLYVNGTLVNSSNSPWYPFRANTGPLRIGHTAPEHHGFFRGRIDEIRIYNRALTVDEIRADMNTPVEPVS